VANVFEPHIQGSYKSIFTPPFAMKPSVEALDAERCTSGDGESLLHDDSK
jgi:hypothetical protein